MISQIQIENFGKIKSLNVDCHNKNLFIVGPNGCGKTTVLQAISLALTGKVAKDIKNEMFVGPFGKDFLIVLTLDDGTKIGRTAKGAKLKTSDERVFNKVKDVYEHLEFDPTLLYNLSYVRQGEIADLFMKGSGKGVIDKLVSMVVNNKRLSEGYSEITKRMNLGLNTISNVENTLKSYQESYDSVKEEELRTKISELESKLKLISLAKFTKKEILSFEELYEMYNTANATVHREKEKYDRSNSTLSQLIKPFKTEKEVINEMHHYEKFSKLSDNLKELEKEEQIWKSTQKHAAAIEKLFRIDLKLIKNQYSEEYLNTIQEVNTSIMQSLTTTDILGNEAESQKYLDNYVKFYGIDSKNILKAKQEFEEIREELKPYSEQIKELRSRDSADVKEVIKIILKEIKELIKDGKEKIDELGDVEKVELKDYTKIKNEWSEYNYALNRNAELKESYKNAEISLAQLKERIKGIPSKEELMELKEAQHNIDNCKSMLQSVKEQLDSLLKIKEKIEVAKVNICNENEKVEQLRYWKEILSDAPNRLRQALFNPVVAHLNKQFYELFSFNGLGEISIDWDKVSISIGNRSFEQCSGAQMVALGLSMRLALLQVMGSYVPLMLVDEPTTFLDDNRKNDVKNLLVYMSKYSQIFACTHDDSIIDETNGITINLTSI